jgi:hypothetical protein
VNPLGLVANTKLYRLLILSFFPASVGGRITAAIVANFFVSFTFAGVYLWSSELFPTVIRYSKLSVMSSFEHNRVRVKDWVVIIEIIKE